MEIKKKGLIPWTIVNVNPLPDRPGMVSAQIAPKGTPIGGDCIDILAGKLETIESLVDQANLALRDRG